MELLFYILIFGLIVFLNLGLYLLTIPEKQRLDIQESGAGVEQG